MPNFVSKLGEWEARQERVVDPSAPQGQEIYEGPDRTAIAMLAEAGGKIGTSYQFDSDLMTRARTLGFKTVDAYLKAYGFDKAKALAAYEQVKLQVVDHKNQPAKVLTSAALHGGGISVAPGDTAANRHGDFTHPSDAPRT